MKHLIILMALVLCSIAGHAQLNVELLHQLVGESKSEHGKQSDVRDRQAESTVSEEANKTLLAKLKDKYRDIHSRFKNLGIAIDAAQIGIEAYPLILDIAHNQQTIFNLSKDDPVLSLLAIQAEMNMVDRANALLNFLYALALSSQDINQMKQSDRRLLFSHVLTELRGIAGASRGLAANLQFSSSKKLLNGLNPFSDFINTDKKLVEDILKKKDMLKN